MGRIWFDTHSINFIAIFSTSLMTNTLCVFYTPHKNFQHMELVKINWIRFFFNVFYLPPGGRLTSKATNYIRNFHHTLPHLKKIYFSEVFSLTKHPLKWSINEFLASGYFPKQGLRRVKSSTRKGPKNNWSVNREKSEESAEKVSKI